MMDIDKEALIEDSFETFDEKSTNSQRLNTSLSLYVCITSSLHTSKNIMLFDLRIANCL